jgi:hypothetical protein
LLISTLWITPHESFQSISTSLHYPFPGNGFIALSLWINLLFTHWVFTGWLLILLRLLTSCGYLLLTTEFQSQSQSYVTTDGQSASLSWNKALTGAYDQICVTVRRFRDCWYGAPSLKRGRVCLLQCTIYNIFTIYMLLPKCIHNTYKVSVSPDSVRQIMSYL